MPSFRARILFCFRVGLAVGLGCAWMLTEETKALYPPGILIPFAAVRALCCFTLGHCYCVHHDAMLHNASLLGCWPDAGQSIGRVWGFPCGVVVARDCAVVMRACAWCLLSLVCWTVSVRALAAMAACAAV